ncbi:MAG: putative toxin-antitoxin system toxin component, PIN family [Verrucomicrobia bacterium]|nr:MAG: putative toxin-antitoxin system toxin component, PIN family [Verrucomicrobiota bacterium]
MRVVLDANVLVAAFAARGLCAAVFETCLAGHELILSEALLAETRRSLRDKLKLPAGLADEVMRLLRENSRLVAPAPVSPEVCRDPDDLHVLGLAEAAQADCLVTGDQDLLVLGRHKGCLILSPRQFAEHLRAQGEG